MTRRQKYQRIIYAARSKRLKELGLPNYEAYLASPGWHQRRSRYWSEHADAKGFIACRYCGDAARDLHHADYRRLGCETDDDLHPLCPRHHEEVHRFGSIQRPTAWMQGKLLGYGLSPEFVDTLTFGAAYDLIGELFG